MPAEIVVDGVRYVPRQSPGAIAIVVLDHGFVYVGRVTRDAEKGETTICGARNLIRWGTSQHLGELVHGPLDATKLGAQCTVRVLDEHVIHTIEVDEHGWQQHCD